MDTTTDPLMTAAAALVETRQRHRIARAETDAARNLARWGIGGSASVAACEEAENQAWRRLLVARRALELESRRA